MCQLVSSRSQACLKLGDEHLRKWGCRGEGSNGGYANALSHTKTDDVFGGTFHGACQCAIPLPKTMRSNLGCRVMQVANIRNSSRAFPIGAHSAFNQRSHEIGFPAGREWVLAPAIQVKSLLRAQTKAPTDSIYSSYSTMMDLRIGYFEVRKISLAWSSEAFFSSFSFLNYHFLSTYSM